MENVHANYTVYRGKQLGRVQGPDGIEKGKRKQTENRTTEATKPTNRKKMIVTNKSRGPMGQWQMSGAHEEEVKTMAGRQGEERVDGTMFNKGHKRRSQKHSKAPNSIDSNQKKPGPIKTKLPKHKDTAVSNYLDFFFLNHGDNSNNWASNQKQ